MKPEKVFELQIKDKAVKQAELDFGNLRDEDPGPIPESEGKTDMERFEAMTSMLVPYISTEKRYQRYSIGGTPVMEFMPEDGESGALGLSFGFNLSFGDIQADWVEIDPETGQVHPINFHHFERLLKTHLTSELDPSLLRSAKTRLSQLEWSLKFYQDAVSRLTPAEARELEFPETIVQELEARSA